MPFDEGTPPPEQPQPGDQDQLPVPQPDVEQPQTTQTGVPEQPQGPEQPVEAVPPQILGSEGGTAHEDHGYSMRTEESPAASVEPGMPGYEVTPGPIEAAQAVGGVAAEGATQIPVTDGNQEAS